MISEAFRRLALTTTATATETVAEFSAAIDAGAANAVSLATVVTVLQGNPDDGGGGNSTNLSMAIQQSEDMQEWLSIPATALNVQESGTQISSVAAIGYRYLRVVVLLENGSKDPPESGAQSICSVNVVTSNV